MYDYIMNSPFVIMSTRSLKGYSSAVASTLARYDSFSTLENFDFTDALHVDKFSDEEMEVSLSKSIRGKDVYLFANAAGNRSELSIDECKIELYHTIDVLRRSQANKIHLFEPYVSSSRSDRTTRRNSVGFWLHYKILTSIGMNHLITYQLHSDKSKTIFDPVLCAIDDIPATMLIKKFLCDEFIKTTDFFNSEVKNNWIFCSVDAGGEKLARKFSNAFDTQLIIAHKQRSYTKANTIESINILSAVPIENNTVWIVDDMIDTGGSIYELAIELSKRNLKELNIAIIHPVFSGQAIKRLKELQEKGILKSLVVCDTIPTKEAKKELHNLHVVSSVNMSAKIISSIVKNEQMTDIIQSFNPQIYLKSPKLFGY